MTAEAKKRRFKELLVVVSYGLVEEHEEVTCGWHRWERIKLQHNIAHIRQDDLVMAADNRIVATIWYYNNQILYKNGIMAHGCVSARSHSA